MGLSLVEQIKAAPKPVDRKAAQNHIEHLISSKEEPEFERLALLIDQYPKFHELLAAVAGHSPYLLRLIQRNPKRLLRIVESDPDFYFSELISSCGQCTITTAGDEAAIKRALRHIKQEAALLIALCDLGGVWDVIRVTEALSDFADASLKAALSFLLAEEALLGRISSFDRDQPKGVVILALGKHGARELNYSSDIDIIVLYDPAGANLAEGVEPSPFFVKLVKGIVRLIDESTAEGYVFRVDLRLRPDPGSTPVAISVNSAFAYYESVGQNWERAALIKARPVAGDLAIGAAFLSDLSPFIWRKYFDFAAIADIHAMKRQIHAVRGHETIAVAGHDIKLGRGGIREIEFFVQTQQLVFGGRRTALRGRRTLDMLGVLAHEKWISDTARDDLNEAYQFLRRIEHRLQMINDEQTQRLPSDSETLKRFSLFCGYSNEAAFSKALIAQAKKVESHYAQLFEEGADLAAREGSLVFTGTTDDPETIETLRRMGFTEPEKVTETVRGWHFGRRSAVTSARAREVLTELIPALLSAFGKTADPDAALAGFDRVLGGMSAAVELFSILREHRPILALFSDILGSAPRLADIVAIRPHLLDAIIDPAFIEPFPELPLLMERMKASIGESDLAEDFLDRLRETGQHEMFLVSVRMLSGVLSPEQAGSAFAAIAEGLIRITLDDVHRRFSRDHGFVKGGRLAVLGMGRLGSREMTATSDLDLVVLYDFDPDCVESDGPRPLDPTVYFGRLTQRLISALTVPTRRGTLYAVDMRLRPSGNKGPAATQYKGFLDYHFGDEADLWEHLALVRARPVAGDTFFMNEVSKALRKILTKPRDLKTIRRGTREMRELLAREKGNSDPWDFKHVAGGLMDIEFVAQALVLEEGAAHSDLIASETTTILLNAKRLGLMPAKDINPLIEAYSLMRDMMQWLRAMVSGDFSPSKADRALLKRLATLTGLPDFKMLELHFAELRVKVGEVVKKRLAES